VKEQKAGESPELAAFHLQHEAMLSLMGAMVAGTVGATLGAGLAGAVWLLYFHHAPTMMDWMAVVNVMMAAGMGGMTGGVGGTWWGAGRAGFLCGKRDV
jgi:hypothetical protein